MSRADQDATDVQRFAGLLERLGQEGVKDAEAEARRRDPVGHGAWARQRLQAGALAKSADPFDRAIAEIMKRDGCSGSEAMSRARREFPAALSRYQEAGHSNATALAKAAEEDRTASSLRKAKVADFNAEADRIASAEGISKAAAAARVRRMQPDLYRAAFSD